MIKVGISKLDYQDWDIKLGGSTLIAPWRDQVHFTLADSPRQ